MIWSELNWISSSVQYQFSISISSFLLLLLTLTKNFFLAYIYDVKKLYDIYIYCNIQMWYKDTSIRNFEFKVLPYGLLLMCPSVRMFIHSFQLTQESNCIGISHTQKWTVIPKITKMSCALRTGWPIQIARNQAQRPQNWEKLGR